MRRIVCLVLALAFWPPLLSGCGAEGTPPVTSYVILEADTSTLAGELDVDEAMEHVESIMGRRCEAFGVRVSDIQRQGTNRLALELSDITAEEARDLVGKTAKLEFKEPRRDEKGNFVCTADTGKSFTVPSDMVGMVGMGDATRPAYLVPSVEDHGWHCMPVGQIQPAGDLQWVTATGIGSDGTEKALTGHLLKATARVEQIMGGEAVLAIQFDSEGTNLLGQITGRLVGLPLAIFVDEEIISAPTVRAHITGGDAAITGIAAEEARTLAIQLNSGALPIPVQVVAVGEGSLP